MAEVCAVLASIAGVAPTPPPLQPMTQRLPSSPPFPLLSSPPPRALPAAATVLVAATSVSVHDTSPPKVQRRYGPTVAVIVGVVLVGLAIPAAIALRTPRPTQAFGVVLSPVPQPADMPMASAVPTMTAAPLEPATLGDPKGVVPDADVTSRTVTAAEPPKAPPSRPSGPRKPDVVAPGAAKGDGAKRDPLGGGRF
jgi:hypothetical protein